jgi:hypothetical protein
VKTISDYSFTGANFKNLRFEEGSQLETIGQNAFSDSFLLQLNIPLTTKSIGGNAFKGMQTTLKITMSAEFKKLTPSYFGISTDV